MYRFSANWQVEPLPTYQCTFKLPNLISTTALSMKKLYALSLAKEMKCFADCNGRYTYRRCDSDSTGPFIEGIERSSAEEVMRDASYVFRSLCNRRGDHEYVKLSAQPTFPYVTLLHLLSRLTRFKDSSTLWEESLQR